MSRGRHIASKAHTGRSKWGILALALGLFLALAIPAGAGPDKVIKSTGKDAATMSANRVLANGGAWDNPCVDAAIAKGYKGKVNMIQPAGNVDIILGMSFGNLDPGTYNVFIDRNGGTPGPWTTDLGANGPVGAFIVDGSGSGEFPYNLPAGSLDDGDYTWAIWVNGPAPCPSILQTDADLEFTIASS